MRQLLVAAFEGAVAQFRTAEVLMPLARWNETVFRFFYSLAVTELERDVIQLTECGGIDLVLHRKSERAFVEFKFYTHSVGYNALSGIPVRMKGYPSLKNRQEFKKCVETLRQRLVPPETLKLVALFYADPVATTRETYEMSYGDGSGIEKQLKILRLTSIGPFPSNDSQNTCNARLYEVGSYTTS